VQNARRVLLAAILLGWAKAPAQTPDTLRVAPRLSTTPVTIDADDPALWLHPSLPESSLVIATDKGGMQQSGGLFVWNMDGSLRQQILLSRPNNVDVRSGFVLGSTTIDIAAVSIRDQDQIRIFKIDPATRLLSDVTTAQGISVLDAPYGLTLYRRSSDGAIFALVSSKSSKFLTEIWQLRLSADDAGKVKGVKVRVFGQHEGIVEGMVADDELGYVYCAEGEKGIHKYYADPRLGIRRLAFFATDTASRWDRKGLALYKCSDSTGYLLAANPDDRSIKVYPREGESGNKHRHPLLAIIENTLRNQGVGIEVTRFATSKKFPRGVLLWHDEKFRKFRFYAWEEVAQNLLTVCPGVITGVASGPAWQTAALPSLTLFPNSPNPFNPQTAIRYVLTRDGFVQLRIHDILGRTIRTLRQEMTAAGEHVVFWDGAGEQQQPAPSGIYFCRAEVGNFVQIRKLTLLR